MAADMNTKMWESPSINGEGHLLFGGSDTVVLAEEYGTPLYVMDEEILRENSRAFVAALEELGVEGKVLYASKAFSNKAMYRIAASEGLGTDVVSAGELHTALEGGMAPEDIYFHGNNKTDVELRMAIDTGIGSIVVDSHEEIAIIAGLAGEAKRKVDVSLRIKPGVEAHTHEYIVTGTDDSKFGLGVRDGEAMRAVESILRQPMLHLRGLHAHIGSQIFDEQPFAITAQVFADFAEEIRSRFDYEIEEINFGGGYGVNYTSQDAPLPAVDYVKTMVNVYLQHHRGPNVPRFVIEPGRAIVGEAGITLYTVGTVKDIPGIRRYISVDGGMGDNPRPALYQAEYSALLANKASEAGTQAVRVAGRYCESGDVLIQECMLPPCERGDVLAVFSTGAYNFSMFMGYNRVARPAVVLVKQGKSALMVQRQSLEQILENDEMPDWL